MMADHVEAAEVSTVSAVPVVSAGIVPTGLAGLTGVTGAARGKPGAGSFARQYRLTKTDEYSSVFGFRKALRSPLFLLHYRPRGETEPQHARLGIIVAKKLVRAAVRRNLIKRLAREVFRQLRPQLKTRDLVLRLGSRPAHYERKLLASEIRSLLLKVARSGTPR